MKKIVPIVILLLCASAGIYALVLRGANPVEEKSPPAPAVEPQVPSVVQTPATAEDGAETKKEAGLVFAPAVFSHEAEAGDKEMTATFVARNPGPSSVNITKLDSSCSCLSVEADTREIAPGGEATITAVFDIEKLSGEAEKSVYVTTDVPGSHEVRLGVRVSIPAIVSIEPTTVKWGIGEAPEPREIRFKVLRDQPIRVTEISSSRESVKATLETVEEGREYRIVLEPDSTDGTLLGFVRIVTDCELEQYQRQLAYYTVHDEPTSVK